MEGTEPILTSFNVAKFWKAKSVHGRGRLARSEAKGSTLLWNIVSEKPQMNAQRTLAITGFASILKGLLLAQPLHTLARRHLILIVTAEEMDKKEVIQVGVTGK